MTGCDVLRGTFARKFCSGELVEGPNKSSGVSWYLLGEAVCEEETSELVSEFSLVFVADGAGLSCGMCGDRYAALA